MTRLRTAVLLACMFACTIATSCPRDMTGGQSRFVAAVLDYLAQVPAHELPTAAECASTAYLRINLSALVQENSRRAEMFLQDVTSVQRNAAQYLSDNGDKLAGARFLQQEISLRRRVLNDLHVMSDPMRQNIRSERVRQLTYIAQAFEQSGNGRDLDDLLARQDVDILQSQAVTTWLKSVSSCPSWRISSAGGISDARLAQDVCSADCRNRAKVALSAISQWRGMRPIDWARGVFEKDLYARVSRAVLHCPRG